MQWWIIFREDVHKKWMEYGSHRTMAISPRTSSWPCRMPSRNDYGPKHARPIPASWKYLDPSELFHTSIHTLMIPDLDHDSFSTNFTQIQSYTWDWKHPSPLYLDSFLHRAAADFYLEKFFWRKWDQQTCNSRDRFGSTFFSRIQASKHQVNLWQGSIAVISCKGYETSKTETACLYYTLKFSVMTYLNLKIMEGHQEFSSQCAIMDISCSKKKGSQELEDHVIKTNIFPNHLSQLLNHFSLSPDLKTFQTCSHGKPITFFFKCMHFK